MLKSFEDKKQGSSYKKDRKKDVKKLLLNNLDEKFGDIEKAYTEFTEYSNTGKALPKGSEWILNDYYLIELRYKKLRLELDKEKKIELHIMERGLLEGYPRIYSLALKLIYDCSGDISEKRLIKLINDYQGEEILALEEIHRFPAVLTLGLMEYIRDMVLNLLKIKNTWEKIDNIDLSIEKNTEDSIEHIQSMDSTEIERFVKRLRRDNDDFQPKLEIIEKKLSYIDKSINKTLEREYRIQSKYDVSLSYAINAIRNISNMNWTRVSNEISFVERVLEEDPLKMYKNMDDKSKSYYKYNIEKLAEKFKAKEIFVTQKALEFAKEEWDKGKRDKKAHIGYYLIDKGREKSFDYFNLKDKNTSIFLEKYSSYYIPIILLSLLLSFLFSGYAFHMGNIYWGILVFILTYIPSMTISTNITNYFYLKKFSPKLLPKMEYKNYIPEEYATIVVIPTLLPNEDRVEELAKSLEVHYLSNKEENIFFALVGDFKNEDEKNTDEDKNIVDKGLDVIKRLNEKYSKETDLFYFFHRERVYSKTQEKWMGWEKKRGALVELNDLLLGNKDTSFNVVSKDPSNLKIKYVITLDADSQLPIDTAKKLIGTISHPLNVAVINEEKNIVEQGYGIIQPRMVIDIDSSSKTLFTRIFAGMGGIDPYSGAVSDIYQDLFGEGIFIGKGIYDLKVFQRCLKEAIPENTVLSHDLLEGSYVRAGLATDIELIDEYPAKFNSYIMRQHRWVRGDWQLLKRLKNKTISSLSKWKIFDNMRRSSLPIFQFLILFLGIVFLPGNVFIWIGLFLITTLLHLVRMAIEYMLYRKFKIPKMILNGNLILGYKTYLYQGILDFMFLPYKAIMMLDAITRTLYRVFISKKNLLEWVTAFDMEKKSKDDILNYYKKMKMNITAPVLLIGLAYIFKPSNLIFSIIVALLWLLGPLAAYMISKEKKEIIDVDEDDIRLLKNTGKETWEYYITFVNSENNYLPPDNFQEHPHKGSINRTSPTNIGFYLISILSSRDLGFITTLEMVELTDLTIETLEKMEKWNGHLYNWYDTETLEPLNPIFVSTVDSGNFISHLIVLKEGIKEYLTEPLLNHIGTKKLINRIESLIEDTKFKSLYDEDKDLFYIGYNLDEHKVADNHYDLLASEARITSYIAVSRKEVPLEHWNRLERSLIMDEGYISLASWSGTMFEYLMPSVVLRNYKNTLLDETFKTVVKMQKDYGNYKNIPWGISESGFYALDHQMNYQYKAFGVPDLGFKRGLKDELVVSPYSTFLALRFDHKAVLENIKRLEKEGLKGPYGFYEAVDYTANRIPEDLDKGIVKSYMSHHQGMIFNSINNFINNDILVDRFHRDPKMKTGEFLLQEKIPLMSITSEEKDKPLEVSPIKEEEALNKRVYTKKDMNDINCHILSSSTYSLMITNRGEGFSKNKDLFVNRWRKDHLKNPYGQFIYIHDLNKQEIWSTTYAPTYKEPDDYKVEFSNYKASFYRKDDDIETEMDIFLLPEELGEIRKVTLTNNGEKEALLEITSYFEVVGETLESDLAHPSFSNLFIRTEVLEEQEGILAHRRKREEDTQDNWIVHGIKSFGGIADKFQYDTSRENFISRGNSLRGPKGVLTKGLSNTIGTVLDPIMSCSKKVRIQPEGKMEVYYITALAHNKEDAVKILDKHKEISTIKMVEELAKTKAEIEIGYLNLNHFNIRFYQDLLSDLFYSQENNKIRYTDILKKNERGQEALWAQGISGDNPLVLVTIESMEGIDTLIEVIDAHEYWSYKGLIVDLVILNKDDSVYYEPLLDNIKEAVYKSRGDVVDRPGGIFIRSKNILEDEEELLIYKWAKLIIKAEDRFTDWEYTEEIPYKEFNKKEIREYPINNIPLDLDYFNGYGGFSKDGKKYIIKLSEGLNTPLPWTNVIANEDFGFIVTEWGTGFTWTDNSRENKLTPWDNDPIIDIPGEIIYLRDDDTGEVWNITPKPNRGKNDYIITHGLGYSEFYHEGYGLNQSLTLYTPIEDRVKINLVKLENKTNRQRNLSLFYYTRPVLGVTDEKTENLLETDMKEDIFMVKNSTNIEYKNSTMFIGTSENIKSYTGDRVEFIGHIPDYENPEGLKKERLSNTVGLGYNPCSAIEIKLNIPANEKSEVVFLLGEDKSFEEGKKTINKYQNVENSKNALQEVKEFWEKKLNKVVVKTPDPAMNYMMNSWLMYQTITCRIWGRAGFYQAGGAFGARDQMQDVTNALYHVPEEAEKQIIRNCKHQYIEGDMQHWWHPDYDSEVHKGIRSKYSDDLLWLPLGVAEYVKVTGKDEILEKETFFIESPVLEETEQERYEIPSKSEEVGTVYNHCIRAIEKSLRFGERGLPLMGSGDWNDGMNKVGYKGKGESVWLGWFLATVLKEFIPICEMMEDFERAERYAKVILSLKESIELNAWDGEWYKRAFFDDGTPIGSKVNMEGTIDSIAQSWSVISTIGDVERSKTALKSVEDHLVNHEEGIIALLTPPFDNMDRDPGYIKSYVPGVRENGGQYTHASTWLIKAFAMLKEGDKAYNLFNMINPINHSRTSIECAKYKVEPYVMAADVYTNPQHIGRGGWTWYTGAAGWMYRVGLEDILGFTVEKDKLFMDPVIPQHWEGYSIRYTYKDTIYNIEVKNLGEMNNGLNKMTLDGIVVEEYVKLINDGIDHFIVVES